jgi:hypothetical protein
MKRGGSGGDWQQSTKNGFTVPFPVKPLLDVSL